MRLRARENWYRDVWLFLVTLFVVAAVIEAVAGSDQARTAAIQAKEAIGRLQRDGQALCAFRNDLQQRVKSTADFLAAHPKGIPGIPASTLSISLANEQHTLVSLKALVC